MNIEDLTKAQLILLTILVNFVMSVATGIITVSLLDQAPQVVTQTINRVVDHTVEKVTEVVPKIVPAAPAPSTQDLVTGAFSAAASREVYLYNTRTGTSSPALARGTYLPSARAVVVASAGQPNEVLVRFPTGDVVAASLSHDGEGVRIYGFADSAMLPTAVKTTLIDAADLKLGQTALALTSNGLAVTGIVARVDGMTVYTSLPEVGSGAAIVDLSGNVIGITLPGTPAGQALSARVVTNLLIK